MLKSSLYDYIDAYILVEGKITITKKRTGTVAREADKKDKDGTFKNCALFIHRITEINMANIDNVKDIDIVMPMSNLIEYSDNYAKKSGSLRQCYRDKPNDNLTDSESFKS